jgi:site-specific DNA recombinase
MKRTAIYARFSTELQHARSIEDQVALCQSYAERNGLKIVAAFEDRARSGASIYGRDGLMRLLDAARDGKLDVILVEALDRLSRDQEDLAGIWKRLNFLGLELRAVHEGTADQIQIGVRGLLGSLFLTDLAHKVRRGMLGVVRDGRNAGGRAYGYRPVPGKRGELEIVEAEADVVRRIFREYVAGKTPREIAHGLNRDGIIRRGVGSGRPRQSTETRSATTALFSMSSTLGWSSGTACG